MFGRSVAQMQGAMEFATPQMGDDSFKHGLHATGSCASALPTGSLCPDNQMI